MKLFLKNKHLVILDNKEIALIHLCLVGSAKKTAQYYKEFIEHCKEDKDDLSEDELMQCQEILDEISQLNNLMYMFEGIKNDNL